MAKKDIIKDPSFVLSSYVKLDGSQLFSIESAWLEQEKLLEWLVRAQESIGGVIWSGMKH